MTYTHTYALLEVSASTYDEVALKLREAGYDESFHGNGVDPFDVIDMHGIALTRAPDLRKGQRRRNAEQLRAAGVDIRTMPTRRMTIRDRRKA